MGPAGHGTEQPSIADGTAIGAYVVGARIGVGGFGEVYRARHSVIGRDVAIKILHRRYSHDAEAIARFVAEARAVNRVSHPGIVETYDFGTVDGRQYCVMELVSGTTLRERLREQSRLPLADALPILTAIAEAIDAAHRAGVAHRDIKPDNIFITDDGVKLIDFGLAKLTRDEEQAVTETGSVFGTPLYMSPEQCRGKGVDLRTDLYSFGVVAYQMLTGELPFTGDALELALHHLNDAPALPSKRCAELPREVDRVLLALLAKNPVERPTTACEAIAAIIGQAPLPTVRLPRSPRRWLVPALAIAALGGALAWVALRERSSPAAVAGSDCPSGASRLAGIWDVAMRSLVAGRFAAVPREDVAAAWYHVSHSLDGYAATWSSQWDAACRSPDKKADPLLYVQRQTCLDNANVALEGVTQSLLQVDIASFAEAHTGAFGLPVLSDCVSVPVLRTQKPAPSPDKRDAVTAALLETSKARADARAQMNTGHIGSAKRGLERLAHAREELERLHPPAAVEPAYWRAHYLANLLTDPAAVSAARAAFVELHELASRVGDDRMQAMAYFEEAWLEERATSDTAKALALVSRGDEAVERAGKPWMATLLLERVRGYFELKTGHFDDAIKHLDDATRRFESVVIAPGEWNGHAHLIQALTLAGRTDDAIAEARRYAGAIDIAFGHRAHNFVREVHHQLAFTLFRNGKLEEAIAETERTFELLDKLRQLPSYQNDTRVMLMELLEMTATLHRDADTETVLARYGESLHPGKPMLANELAQLAGWSAGNGYLDAATVAAERATTAPVGGPEGLPAAEDMAAYFAFMRGDVDRTEQWATRAIANDADGRVHKIGLAPSLLAWVKAKRGDRAGALSLIASRPKQMETELAHVWPLIALGRWREARAHAETAITFAPKEPVFDHAEAYAFLGMTRLETGDAPAAVTLLDESLAAAGMCCYGNHYFVADVQFALARALVLTGGDATRARSLATKARKRLRPDQTAERKRIDDWLATQPAQ